MSVSQSRKRIGPKRTTSRFKGRVGRKWRHRLEPPIARRRRPQGLPGAWAVVKRILWAWRLWAVVALWALATDAWTLAGLTGLAAAITYTMAPSERSALLGLDHDMAVEAEGFLDSLIGLTGSPFLGGNKVSLLNNGDEFYPVMLADIDGARHSVTIEAYIYWEGATGLEFARRLAERSRAGVLVKILLDAVGSATIGAEILTTLEAGGCQVAWFHPLRWYKLGRLNYRTHRKSLIVDGRIGFTGGAGIADIWTGHAQDPDHWRDMQIRIEGPGAIPLQTGFAQNWQITTGELVNGPEFFPEPVSVGRIPVQTIASSPTTGTSGARTLYYLAIVCARRSILIANPYFVPDSKAMDLLVEAERRGIAVKVMVASDNSDNWLARRNSVRLYGPLLKAGIDVYEYERSMLHHKTMVVDGRWATIGTTNFDDRSFLFNDESNVSFVEPSLVKEMERTFHDDLGECRRVTYAAWRKRGLSARVGEFVASFLKDQV
jgi:cardiolipin synthase